MFKGKVFSHKDPIVSFLLEKHQTYNQHFGNIGFVFQQGNFEPELEMPPSLGGACVSHFSHGFHLALLE
jgi:hypothetical protein